MNIEKLPSGSYRVVQMYEGKRYRITLDYKPTKKEAQMLIDDKIGSTAVIKGTFKHRAKEYIDSKRSVLSPATIREYTRNIERIPAWFTKLPMSRINQVNVQQVVNEMSETLAPKTVKDRYRFITAVAAFCEPGLRIPATLPQTRLTEPSVPRDEDVQRLLEYVKENEPTYYVPLVLACYSLRRSEICALTKDDLEGNVIHVCKALVEDENGNWVVKQTKTTKSERYIPIPQDVADSIRENGIYNGFPGQLTKCIHRCNRKLGITDYSLHKLRHYFASKLVDLNIDQKTIQELGGWSGNETVSRIYQHSLAMKDRERVQGISDQLASSILRG